MPRGTAMLVRSADEGRRARATLVDGALLETRLRLEFLHRIGRYAWLRDYTVLLVKVWART